MNIDDFAREARGSALACAFIYQTTLQLAYSTHALDYDGRIALQLTFSLEKEQLWAYSMH